MRLFLIANVITAAMALFIFTGLLWIKIHSGEFFAGGICLVGAYASALSILGSFRVLRLDRNGR